MTSNQFVKAAYSFISEALIIFLLILPVLYFYDEVIPYWGYLGIAFLACFLFSFISIKNLSNTLYLIAAPILLVLFMFIGLPIFLSFIVTALWIWRYVWMRSGMVLIHPVSYISFTILLSLMMLLVTKESYIIVYLLVQFFVIVFGNSLSHIVEMKRDERKQVNYGMGLYFFLALIIGSISAYWILQRPIVYSLLTGAMDFVFSVVGRFVGLFQFLEDQKFGEDKEQLEIDNGTAASFGADPNQPGPLSGDRISSGSNWIWLVLAIITLLFLTYLWKKRKIFVRKQKLNNEDSVTVHQKENNTKSSFKRKRRRFTEPQHVIRKLVYRFEKKTLHTKYERKSFETLEDWLNRIGVTSYLHAYQKVRYGEQPVSEQEITGLKQELKIIERKLGGTGGQES
ncbi:hypothetical protein SAMN05216389_101212 [Oceanobacillus limi]|uniref:DUF4129 domain-containing protein n=1 Tax=Oceanobacillus limi TaxID=930131 RepID=A0A1H9Y664_9BACI|nr:hypothetical protein [Oceanobacillus limi]SES64225.1 hypothetical protein SAMN05216389_101212 [Oceanobacillus limi]